MYEKLKTFLLKQTPETPTKRTKTTGNNLLRKKQEFLARILSRMNKSLDVYINVDENPGDFKARLKHKPEGFSIFWSVDYPEVSDEYALEKFREFLSPQYTPPTDTIELRTDLQMLFDYYMTVLPHLKNIPQGLAARIDFVMTQVACVATEHLHVIDTVGLKQDGIHARRKRKGEVRNAMAQDVLDIFYRLDHKEFTFHGLAKKIRSHLAEKKQQRLAHLQGKALKKENKKEVRSISSIKRDLLNDPPTKAILTRDKLIG